MSHFLCDLVVDDAGWPHKVMSNVMRLWSESEGVQVVLTFQFETEECRRVNQSEVNKG